jgi:hypothetical protein
MKFLKSDGTVEYGTPVSDRQEQLLDRLEVYLHEKICRNSYHGMYNAKHCREVTNAIVPKLHDSACVSLLAAIFEPELPPEVIAEPELEATPEPIPTQPVSVSTTNDDIPF